jgi:putative FmdB family regulatory protein
LTHAAFLPFYFLKRGRKPTVKEGCVMPTYEYLCEKCGEEFSVVMSISEHDKKRVTCPKCKGRKVSPQISGFTTITSKKS